MKNFKRFAAFILSAAVVLSLGVSFAPHSLAAQDPAIEAASSMLVELNTGKVLYAKNENVQLYPASVTKIMTVYVALKACAEGTVSLDDVVTAGNDIYFDISEDGSSANIKPGEQMLFKDILYCALLASANEACNIIAEHVSGNVRDFVTLMNVTAAELGCTGTHFDNTHGMPNVNHYITANDLYIITKNAMDIPEFAEIVKNVEYTVPETNLSKKRKLENTNKLLQSDTNYYYEYCTGIKTGYTSSAGYCLVSSAEKDDLRLLSVVMGASAIQREDGTTITQQFTETKRLFEWGFNNFSYRTVVDTIDLVADVPVELGDGADSVVLRPETSVVALLDNSLDLSTAKKDIVIYSERDGEKLRAPIEQGEVLGEMHVTLDGEDYGTVKLVANSGIELKKFEYLKQKVKSFFSNLYVKLIIILVCVILALYIALVINYNIKRKRRREAQKARARAHINELRRTAGSTVGKSFEEIEEIRRKEKEHR